MESSQPKTDASAAPPVALPPTCTDPDACACARAEAGTSIPMPIRTPTARDEVRRKEPMSILQITEAIGVFLARGFYHQVAEGLQIRLMQCSARPV